MTKRQITETLEGDWMNAIDGIYANEAITYFQSLPQHAMLEVNYHGYDGADGCISVTREETDEEYFYRIQCEMEALEAAKKKAEKKRLDDQKNIDMALAQLQEKMDALLKVRPK